MDPFEGFSDFIAEHSPAMSRLAYVLTGNHADAQDLLQTALLKSARHWRRIVDCDNPVAYLRKIMVNEAATRWRRGRLLTFVGGQGPDRPQPDATASSVPRLVLRDALNRLTARQRTVLVLRFYEDLSVEETAELLGCAPGTVKSQTHHALSRLRVLAPELADLEVTA